MNYKKLLIISLSLLIAGIIAVLFLPRYLELDTYKPAIIAELRKQLGREVRFASSSIRLGWGAVFTFNDVVISEKDSTDVFLKASEITLKVPLIPLLRGHFALRNLSLKESSATITRFKDGRLNISDLTAEKPGGASGLSLHRISLTNSSLIFKDNAVSSSPITTMLSDVNLQTSNLQKGKQGKIKLSFSIATSAGTGKLSLQGKLRIPLAGRPLTTAFFDGSVAAESLDPWHFWPYYQQYVKFKRPLGTFTLSASLKGSADAFSSKGKVSVSRFRFDFRPIFHAILAPEKLRFTYTLEKTSSSVDVKELALFIDGAEVKGSCAIQGVDGKDPRIVAKATSTPLDLEKFGGYIPYGIISDDVSVWIEQHIKSGKLRLEKGLLNGTVSQIMNMGVGTNYNVLDLTATINEGVVSYGPDVPLFNQISGRLSLKGRDFIMQEMQGRFGFSPFKGEGKITEYVPTPIPCGFPFTMQMKPHQTEIAWLAGQKNGGRLTFGGTAPLTLTGSGPTTNYALSAVWQLTDAQYAVPDLVAKPPGIHSTFTARSLFTPQGVTLTGSEYDLGPLKLSLSGAWLFRDKADTVTLKLQTNRVSTHEVTPYLPAAQKYTVKGKAQASLSATGSGMNLKQFAWRGDVDLQDFGCRISEQLQPLSGLTGKLHLDNNRISSEHFTGTLGTTNLAVKGDYQWGIKPAVQITFSTPTLHLQDIGLIPPSQPLSISRVRGGITYENNKLTIKQMTAQINSSPLSLTGEIADLNAPDASFTVHSPFLDLSDVIALASIKKVVSPSARATTSPPLKVTADITAENGKMGTVAFSHLQTRMEVADSILYLQPYSFELYGGKASGRARLDFGADASRYQISYTVSTISAAQLLPALGITKQKVTGRLSGSGDITCRGENIDTCKETALGTVSLKIQKGSINRFSTLSKIFSILNVSQLFKFKLPDMVSGGMPFTEITTTIGMSDGLLTTKDLLINSEAMNISAVGSYSLPKDEINATIGVQPLQAIDSLVSRIPVVGWILTGKEKTLITAYFEAKGPAHDPKVSAIPVKSMAKGTLDIFIRIFTLPAKLFTDTGEVILNK